MSTAAEPAVSVSPARYVTVRGAAVAMGLTEKAIRNRLDRGIWLENIHWRRAPDNRIYIDWRAASHADDGARASDPIIVALNKRTTMSKHRAATTGMAYDIDPQFMRDMLAQQGGRCAVTGREFSLERIGRRGRPYAPSIDRVDSDGGYTRGNVRIVLACINYMMNDYGEQVVHGAIFGEAAADRPAKAPTP